MNNENKNWLLLIASLPTASATPRMRLWRGIKALGCAALRDGAYLVPDAAGHGAALEELAAQANGEGGQAWVVQVTPRSLEDAAALVALFDRSAEYAALRDRLGAARREVSAQMPAEIVKTRKRLRKELESLQRIDFFPGDGWSAAEASWADFETAAHAVLSPGEPQPQQRALTLLDSSRYQGRIWATRRNLWVDRIASAWLIRRHIDRTARFMWLDTPAGCPPDALGFDFDQAAFTHCGDKVTFEVLLTSFGLDGDHALAKLGGLVHALDVGGPAMPEAAGFEAIVAGARSRLGDDDALLQEIGGVLDSLYAHFRQEGRA